MKKCRHCNTQNNDSNKYCIKCGRKLLPDTAPDTKTPASKYKRGLSGFRIFLILLFSFLGVTIIILTTLVIFTDIFSRGDDSDEMPGVLEEITPAELSEEQDRLVGMLGYPDEFVITLDRDGEVKRVETWMYADLEAYFIFQDGIYMEGDRIVAPELKADRLGIRPQDFNLGMTRIHLDNMMGYQGQWVEDPSTGFTLVEYAGGELLCSFDDDGILVAVNRSRRIKDRDEE